MTPRTLMPLGACVGWALGMLLIPYERTFFDDLLSVAVIGGFAVLGVVVEAAVQR